MPEKGKKQRPVTKPPPPKRIKPIYLEQEAEKLGPAKELER